MTRAADSASRPTATIRPSPIATSAVRAGAPVPSTTVPPRIKRSHGEVIHLACVEPVERAPSRVRQIVVVLPELVDDAGILRVVVWEVRRPDHPVVTDELTQRTGGAF